MVGITIRKMHCFTFFRSTLGLFLVPRFLRRLIPGATFRDLSLMAFLRLSAIRLKRWTSQPVVDTDNSMGFRPENFKAFKLFFAEFRSLNGPT